MVITRKILLGWNVSSPSLDNWALFTSLERTKPSKVYLVLKFLRGVVALSGRRIAFQSYVNLVVTEIRRD